MIRNVTDGTEIHEARAVEPGHVVTGCGIGPLIAGEWKFTNDKVTCAACKEQT